MTDSPSASGAPSPRLLTLTTLPFFLGGFLGPVGTISVISIYPELRETFDVSNSAVSWSLSGYFFPMAALMLVSGTIGERFGRKRVTRLAFVLYAVASLGCVLAPNFGLFIAARVMQGVCNSFITPLLIAGLAEVIQPHRLGKAVGIYSGFQALGGAVAPFVSGLAAEINWRWAFVVIGVIAIALAMRPPPGAPRPAASAPPIRPLLTVRMGSLWIAALSAAAGPIGIGVLVGVYLRDGLGVDSSTAGAILLLGGLSAMAISPTLGKLVDVWGTRRAALTSGVAATAATVPLGLIDSAWWLALVWLASAVLVGFVTVNLQHLAAIAVPDNRGGALSSVLSFRFSGHAIGPILFVPLLADSPVVAFGAAGALGVVTLASFAVATNRRYDIAPLEHDEDALTVEPNTST